MHWRMKAKEILIRGFVQPLRRFLGRLPEKNVMMILSLVVGIFCGLAAVLLKLSIEFIHHNLIALSDKGAYNLLNLIYPGVGWLCFS